MVEKQKDNRQHDIHAAQSVIEPALVFRKAQAEDAQVIVALVNSGYRGDQSRAGWTTEADYLDGKRTDEQEVRELIAATDGMILLCLRDNGRDNGHNKEVVGSVYLQHERDAAYLGMFVVKPTLQGLGIGKQFMHAAERIVQQEWRVATMRMTVISIRSELLAYYERRGYRRTGERKPFPTDDPRSSLRVASLEFEVLEKSLTL